MWVDFLSRSINTPTCPIFYQFVVDSIFNTLIRHHFRYDKLGEESLDVQLNYQQQNSLRYTAGYVIRALIKKVNKCSAHPIKNDMLCCLMEMNEKSTGAKEDSEDWMAVIDRGTFGVFASMELEVRQFLSGNPTQLGKINEELPKQIRGNDDVQFFWRLKRVRLF